MLLRARGYDPKGVRAGMASASHSLRDGTLSITASACSVSLRQGPALISPATLIYPFLTVSGRQDLASATQASLAPGTSIHALDTALQETSLELVCVRYLPKVHASLKLLAGSPSMAGQGGWQVGWQSSPSAPEVDAALLASHVAVFVPQESSLGKKRRGAELACTDAPPPWPQQALLLRLSASAARPATGSVACVHGAAPFAALSPRHFRGLVSRGVIAAVLSTSSRQAPSDASSRPSSTSPRPEGGPPALLLSDVQSLPGMEGASVHGEGAGDGCAECERLSLGSESGGTTQTRTWIGMLLPPLVARSAHAEVATVAPVAQLRAALADLLPEASEEIASAFNLAAGTGKCLRASPCSTPASADVLDRVRRSVVALSLASGWASGILVGSKGLILTNAHLFHPVSRRQRGSGLPPASEYPPVRASVPGHDQWVSAQVLHVFRNGMDLAVLSIPPRNAKPIGLEIEPASPQAGQRVLSVGYPLLNPVGLRARGASAASLSPAVSRGVIASVLACPPPQSSPPSELEALIISTATVHSGASGGALVSARTGRLVGLVTSNARLASGQVLPKINFSLPAARFRDMLEAAEGEGWRRVRWERWDVPDAALEEVWAVGQGDREEEKRGGGGFGGARPPAELVRLLDEATRKESKLQPCAHVDEVDALGALSKF